MDESYGNKFETPAPKPPSVLDGLNSSDPYGENGIVPIPLAKPWSDAGLGTIPLADTDPINRIPKKDWAKTAAGEEWTDVEEVWADADSKHDWGTTDARDAKVDQGQVKAPKTNMSSIEKARLVAEKGFAELPLTGRNDGFREMQQAKNLLTKIEQNPWLTDEDTLKKISKLQKEGTDKLASYIVLRSTLDKDIQEADPNFVEQLWGGAAAGLTDPVNLLGVGNGTTLVKTIAKQFGVGFALGGVSGAAQGDYDKSLGLRNDNPAVKELLEAGFTSGMVAAALSSIFHITAKIGKPPATDSTTQAISTEIKATVERAKKEVNSETVDPVVADPLPTISEKFRDESWTDIDASQAQFMDSLEPPDSVRPAVVEGPIAPDPTIKASKLPELDKDFKTIRPEDWKEDWADVPAPEQRVPYQEPQGAVPMEPFVDLEQKSPGSPYMGRQLAEVATAEGVPGTHELVLDDADYKAANAYDKFLIERFPDEVAKHTEGAVPPPLETGVFAHRAKVVNDLYKAKTLADVRRTLEPIVPENYKSIWDKAVNGMDDSVGFHILDRDPENMTDAARTLFNDEPGLRAIAANALQDFADGSSQVRRFVALRGLDSSKHLANTGFTVETVAHEIYHTRTQTALRVGLDPQTAHLFPNENKFATTARDLWKQTVEQMHVVQLDRFASALENLDEFVTYAFSNPEFQTALKGIKVGTKSMFQRVVEAVKELFGITSKESSVFDAMMDLSSGLDKITMSKEAYLAYIERGRLATDQLFDYSKMDDKELPSIVASDLTEFKNAQEVLDYIGNHEVGDLGYTFIRDTPLLKDTVRWLGKYFTTTPQMERLFRHPILTWIADRIPAIHREAEVRLQRYKESLADVIALNRKDQLTLFKGLVDLNNPSTLDARTTAVANGTEAQLLQNYLPEELIPRALEVLDVMKDLHEKERGFAIEHGRNIKTVPMYFPRSHGGTFKFHIKDQSGKILYIKGFENLRSAQAFHEQAMKEVFANGPQELIVTPIERSDVSGFVDSIGDLITLEALPEHIRKQVQTIESRFDTARQKFELERSEHNIGGFIGEVLYGEGSGLGRAENNRLLEMLNNRIDDSYRFETRTRIIKDIAEPMMWNPEILMGKPQLSHAVNNIVLRELGHDVSLTRNLLDNPIQRGLDEISKNINKMVTTIHNQKLTNNITSLGPQAVHNMAQMWTWATSLWKLALHPPILAINSLAMAPFPFIAIDGTRTAFKERVNPMIPQLAYFKTLSYVADKEGASWMRQAKLEGMIEARAADQFQITERNEWHNQADKWINMPRNLLEKGTNFTTILYYYNYYKMARPDLVPTSDTFKTLVYKAARSWTGDYTSFATPMSLSKMGVAGRLSGNFSKWTMNQVGRFQDDLVDIRNNPSKIQAYLPLVANMTGIVLMGGMLGLPVVVDYEYWRYVMKKAFDVDMVPFSAFYDKANKFSKDTIGVSAPGWMKRGAITEGFDQLAQLVPGGLESGIDVSGSLRHAPILQANTVAVELFLDMYMAAHKGSKAAWKYATKDQKPVIKDVKDIIDAAPTFAQPTLKTYFTAQQRKNQEGNTEWVQQNRYTDEGDYARSDTENLYGLGGFRTKAENEAKDFKDYTKWLERTTKARVGELIDETLANLGNKQVVNANLKELYAKAGEQGIQNLENQLVGKPIKRSTTYEERKIQEIINSVDLSTKQELLKAIKDYQALKSRSTSSSR